MGRLPNAPLQEVIFEVRWELDVQDGTGMRVDKRFEPAVGVMKTLAKATHPVMVRRFPDIIQSQALPHTAIWQFRPTADGWPLVQLGPGVLTVNDRDPSYDWEHSYFPLIKKALEWLAEAYDGLPVFVSAELRYIDSVRKGNYPDYGPWESFIPRSLRFSFQNEFDPKGPLLGAGLHQVFQLPNDGQLLIALSTGEQAQEETLMWETSVFQPGQFDGTSLVDWLQEAHTRSRELFRELCQPDFHASFARAKEP